MTISKKFPQHVIDRFARHSMDYDKNSPYHSPWQNSVREQRPIRFNPVNQT